MTFKVGDRVEHVNCDHRGTVTNDNGIYVWVNWDDGQKGIVEYNKNVCFNAYRLQKLANAPAS